MPHYARAGAVATETVTLEEGPLILPNGACLYAGGGCAAHPQLAAAQAAAALTVLT